MRGALHFVGVFPPVIRGDDRYDYMVRIFGVPDFVHRRWDRRARDEIVAGDVAVFADGLTEAAPVNPNAYDDSAFQ